MACPAWRQAASIAAASRWPTYWAAAGPLYWMPEVMSPASLLANALMTSWEPGTWPAPRMAASTVRSAAPWWSPL